MPEATDTTILGYSPEFWLLAGTFATGLATAIVAIVALFIARRQIRTTHEVEALNAYEKYHHLCLQYPEYGCGAFDYERSRGLERRQYVTFALSMLLTVERILMLFPKNDLWRQSFFDDFAQHESFLRSQEFQSFEPSLQPELRELIGRFLNNEAST